MRDVTSVRCEVAVMPLTEEPTITCSRMCERAHCTESSMAYRIRNRVKATKGILCPWVYYLSVLFGIDGIYSGNSKKKKKKKIFCMLK